MAQVKDKDLLSIQEARDLLERAERAGDLLREFTQEQVDRVIEAMAEAARAQAGRLAELAVEETGRGKVSDKTIKNLFAAVNIYGYIRDLKTCGVISQNKEKGVVEIAVPVGVVAAIVPMTNPTSTAIFKILATIKGRNPVVLSPHPQAVQCTAETARIMYEAARKAGAPEDCIGCVRNVTRQGTTELMHNRKSRMILATGGPGLVKAAYSSGKPAFGVGPGNVSAFIERTADVSKAVRDVVAGKTFDNGLLCSSEQAMVCDLPLEEEVLLELKKNRAHLLDDGEQERLEKVVQLPQGGLNTAIVGKSPQVIAEMAGFTVSDEVVCLVGRAHGVGREHPLSMEKLSPILAFYVEDGWEAGCRRCIEILNYGGLGHTMSIHSRDEDVIMEFGLHKPAYRICVNTPATHGAIGLTTGVPPSMTLGCGTPGGNITSDNITPLHLINIRRLAYETRSVEDITFDRVELTTPAEEKPDEVIGKADQTATRTGVRKIVRAVIEDFVREQQTAPAVVPREPAPPARSGPVPRAKVLAGPVRDFVCEDDVRQALRDGRKITVSARTIMTPSALDAAEGRKVFIWE